MRRLWWHDKPWFEIDGSDLILKGVPVPDRTRLPLNARVRIERILVELPPILQRLTGYNSRIHRPGTGRTICLRVIERLARLQAESCAKILIVAQYDARAWTSGASADEQRTLTRAILSHAAANGLATLDTYQRFAAEPERRRLYGRAHLNARGNRIISHLLAAALQPLL